MNFLIAIIESLVGFVRRNPLTVLVVLLLAIAAPALLRGIALFVLYFILALVLLAVAGVLLFRWRIYRVRRQMEEQFGEGFDRGFGDSGAAGPFSSPRGRRASSDGEVKVYRTSSAPEKRVSKDVGDYVDFEETKE